MLPFNLKPSSREREQKQKGESAESIAILKEKKTTPTLFALAERILFRSSLDLLWKMVSASSGEGSTVVGTVLGKRNHSD